MAGNSLILTPKNSLIFKCSCVKCVCCTCRIPAVDSWPATLGEETADTSSDFLIASMMQLEMDSEHDRQLRREQDKKNVTSKGSLIYIIFIFTSVKRCL